MLQQGLATAGQEERLKQVRFGLMMQQIAVKLSVRGRQPVEGQRDDRLGLLSLAKSIGRAGQFLQLLAAAGRRTVSHGPLTG